MHNLSLSNTLRVLESFSIYWRLQCQRLLFNDSRPVKEIVPLSDSKTININYKHSILFIIQIITHMTHLCMMNDDTSPHKISSQRNRQFQISLSSTSIRKG